MLKQISCNLLLRKMFHMCAVIVPIFYLLIPRTFMITTLFYTTLLIVLLDFFKFYNSIIKRYVSNFFITIMKEKEIKSDFALTGISFMMISFLVTCFFFSKHLAIISWLILVFADPIANIVGIKFGSSNNKSNDKSFEGSLAFLCISMIISVIFFFIFGYKINLLVIFSSCVVTTLVEFFSNKLNIDDNLLIPLVYCAFTKCFYY